MDSIAEGRPKVYVQERTIIALPNQFRQKKNQILLVKQDHDDDNENGDYEDDHDNDSDDVDITLVHEAPNQGAQFTVFVIE